MKRKQLIFDIPILVLVSVLPFGPALPNILGGIVLACGLILGLQSPKPFKVGEWVNFGIVNGYVVFYGISLFWSSNLESGISKWSGILWIPAFFLLFQYHREKLSRKFFGKALSLFSLSLCVLFLLSAVVLLKKGASHISDFTQNDLSTALLDFHYLGLSLYSGLALLLNLYYYLDHRQSLPGVYRRLSLIVLVILIAGLICLSSRTTIALVLILVVLMYIRSFILKQSRQARGYLIILLGLAAIVSLSNPTLKEKMFEAINYNQQYEIKDYWGGRGFRELIWNCSQETIAAHFWFGVGIGDQKGELDRCYRIHRYEPLLIKGNNFNSHNIFLQIMLATGLIGVILLLLSIGYCVYVLAGKRALDYLLFVVLFFGTGLTESHFNRNAIVLLFAIFHPFLLFLNQEREGTSTT